MSYDEKQMIWHHAFMSSGTASSVFKQEFIARTKKARLASRKTQAEMADMLGMKQDKYKQYETRTLLPHYLIIRFCLATDITEKWLFSGRAGTAKILRIRKKSVA